MALVLAATGRTNYCEELLRHLNHIVAIYPDYILKYFNNGGFVVNLSASSVFPDECHQMTINKDMALKYQQDFQTKIQRQYRITYHIEQTCESLSQ